MPKPMTTEMTMDTAMPTHNEIKTVYGRDNELALLNEVIQTKQEPLQHRIMSWYGPGGQGKSTLYKWFDRHLRKQSELAVTNFTFEGKAPRDPESQVALYRDIRLSLIEHKIPCPVFDIAFACYHAKANPQNTTEGLYKTLVNEHGHSFIEDCVRIVSHPLANATGETGSDLVRQFVELASSSAGELFSDRSLMQTWAEVQCERPKKSRNATTQVRKRNTR